MAPNDRPQLHLITDPRLPRAALLRAVAGAAPVGVDWVQVRAPGTTAREVAALTGEILAICRPQGIRVAVNDRLDVALALGADGAQLGTRSLPVAMARRIADDCRIGASVHTLAAARAAEADGADWLTFGHIFPTASHSGQPPQGLAALAAVAHAARVPVIAIGGISAGHVAAVLAAGASGIAVISAILAAPDPVAATVQLRQLLDAAPPG